MKQRRFPVVPVTILTILVGGAVVMSLKPLDAQPQAPEAPKEVVSESREELSAKNVASIANKQAGSKRSKLDPEAQAQSQEPAIFLPGSNDYKPSPNPTSTSMQWYRKDSRKN